MTISIAAINHPHCYGLAGADVPDLLGQGSLLHLGAGKPCSGTHICTAGQNLIHSFVFAFANPHIWVADQTVMSSFHFTGHPR